MATDPEVPVTMHIEETGGVKPPIVSPPAAVPIEREAENGVIETVERPRSQREIAMEQIAAARRVAIEKELTYGEDMADRAREDAGQQPLPHAKRARPAEYDEVPAEPVSGNGEPPVAQERQPETPAATVAAPTPAAPAGQPQQPLQTITVGGVQYRVTPEQIAHLASVGAVAIEAMNRERQNPQQHAAQPVQQQSPRPVQPQPQQPVRQPQQILTPEEIRALAPRLQSYNENESAAALADLTGLMAARLQAQNPQINPQALAEYATKQALAQMQQQQALNHNLATIGQEFPEIFNNARLSQVAAIALHENRRRDAMLGIQKSDLDAYREACTSVVEELNLRPNAQPQPGQAATNPRPSQAGAEPAQPAALQPQATSRFDAKRAAPRSPIPAQRVQASQAQGQRYPTPSEIVAKMKQQRGQVV